MEGFSWSGQNVLGKRRVFFGSYCQTGRHNPRWALEYATRFDDDEAVTTADNSTVFVVVNEKLSFYDDTIITSKGDDTLSPKVDATSSSEDD